MSIKLGSKCQDSVSGFVGIAVSRKESLFETPRVKLERACLKDGALDYGSCFPEGRLIVLEEPKDPA